MLLLPILRVAAVCLALTAPAAAPAQDKIAPPAPSAPAPAAPAVAPAPTPTAAPFSPLDRPFGEDLKADRADLAETGGDSLIWVLLKTLLVLGLVLALVYVTLNWGLRKLLRINPTRQAVVKVHERVALDTKKTLYLVEAGDDYLLLGAGEREVSFLTRLDTERIRAALAKKAERPAVPALSGKPFWQRLLVKPPPKPSGGGEGGGGSNSSSSGGGTQTTS